MWSVWLHSIAPYEKPFTIPWSQWSRCIQRPHLNRPKWGNLIAMFRHNSVDIFISRQCPLLLEPCDHYCVCQTQKWSPLSWYIYHTSLPVVFILDQSPAYISIILQCSLLLHDRLDRSPKLLGIRPQNLVHVRWTDHNEMKQLRWRGSVRQSDTYNKNVSDCPMTSCNDVFISQYDASSSPSSVLQTQSIIQLSQP